MTDATSDLLSSLGLKTYGTQSSSSSTESSGQLQQSDFLKLMTTQLTNQDPMEPMDNGEFLGQMAQFSTVTGIEQLASSFEKLSLSVSQGQALQAAALVGKSVMVPASSAELAEGQGITGGVDLAEAATGVTVTVTDASGQAVRTIDLGAQSAGLAEFSWDGATDDGTPAPAGTYTFTINAKIGGENQAQTTLLDGQVSGVSYDSTTGGLMLAIASIGDVDFSDVYRIQ